MTETAPGGPVQSTAQIEKALLEALGVIRSYWPAMLLTGGSSSIAGKPSPRSLYTRPDHDERDDDLPPIDRRVSLSQEVTVCLNGWARVIVEDRDLSHGLPNGTDTLGLVTLLERHARWFSGHEAAEDARDELAAYAGKIRATVMPTRRDWMYLGDCPFVVDDWFCQGRVRAFYDARLTACTDCGQEAVTEWWLDVLGVISTITRDELPAFIRREFGKVLSPSTVRRLLNETGVDSCGTDAKGRSLFDRGAVAYALTKRWAA